MGAWGTAVFSDDLAQDIRREYHIMLSTGKTNSEAERLLKAHYSSLFNCANPDEDVFWFALALCEWKAGRLSDEAKAKALAALESGNNLAQWETCASRSDYIKRKNILSDLHALLLSPMPPTKKIRKPTVHHCPWSVGSLLAYRIVSSAQRLGDHPCFRNYVLVRVVGIERRPISNLFDTGYYDELMLLGLYNWMGSSIPDAKIAESLQYIPIRKTLPVESPNMNDSFLRNIGASFGNERIEKCVYFDWVPTKAERGDITYLACDENFENNLPAFFEPKPQARVYTHYLPFDIQLAKRFEICWKSRSQAESVLLSDF